MSTIFVFPGQGSQAVGMGEGLFDQFSELTQQASDYMGMDIRKLCLEGPAETLNQTRYTQPALYTVNAFSYMARVEELGHEPDFLAGHSLGEYNALLAAGVYDFMTGFKLVDRRGDLMAEAPPGGMAAVLGLPVSQIRNALVDNGLDTIDVANLNAPTQTVISGPKDAIRRAEGPILAAGAKRYVVLNVSGAFHSRYMAEAAKAFHGFMLNFQYAAPSIPVIANYTAAPYPADRDGIIENLTKQIEKSVRWVETVQVLAQKPEPEFEEIGPGKVLSGLIRQIQRG